MSANNSMILTEVEEIKNESISALAKYINLYGLNLSEARLFSLMFLEDKAMTLDEMSKELGISKSSISTNIRELEELNMAEQTWRKGSRKDLYKVNKDLYDIFSSAFLDKWAVIIKKNRNAYKGILRDMDIIVSKIEDQQVERSLANYGKKINAILDFYNWVDEMFREMRERIDKINA